jgi:hypothetical protein
VKVEIMRCMCMFMCFWVYVRWDYGVYVRWKHWVHVHFEIVFMWYWCPYLHNNLNVQEENCSMLFFCFFLYFFVCGDIILSFFQFLCQLLHSIAKCVSTFFCLCCILCSLSVCRVTRSSRHKKNTMYEEQ